MQDSIELLDKDYIASNVSCGQLDIDIFESVDSTSEYLKKNPAEKYPKVCLAEQQTLGKGRLGKSWYSPFGQNIYLSCCYSTQKEMNNLAGLSLVVSLALIDACKEHLSGQLKVKWPNDILYDGEKIAGVLVDVQTKKGGANSIIVGIGLNVNMISDEECRIPKAWSSMRKITGKFFNRNKIVISLIDSLLQYLARFIEKDFLDFMQEWQSLDHLFNKQVCFEVKGNKIIGIAKGIDQLGQLLLEFPDGSIKTFSAGEVVFRTR